MLPRQKTNKNLTKMILFGTVCCIFALLFIIGFFKAFVQDYTVRKQISALEKEKAQLNQNKLNLLNRLQDIKSDSFAEKEARLKFGLQKPGESVIILNDKNNALGGSESAPPQQQSENDISNAGRWWRYFFHF